MPETFAITTKTTAVPLDGKRQGSAGFAVANTSGRALRGRARIAPADPAAAPWLALGGPAEQPFTLAGSAQYTVQIAAPATAPAGSYAFHLVVVGVDNPDEEFAASPSVTFTVPPPPPPAKPFPWLLVAGAAVLLVVAGVVIFLLVGDSNGKAAAAARFDGDWLIASGSLRLQHSGSTVQGDYTDSLDGQLGTVQGTVANDTLSGQWTLHNGATGSFKTTISPSNTTLAGAHPLCGARISDPFPAGCSFAGAWNSLLNNQPCLLNLTVAGLQGGGTACNIGTMDGLLALRSPATILLTGQTGSANNQVQYLLFLNADATQFQGSATVTIITPFGGRQVSTQSWCGARPDHSPPAVCFRAQ